MDIASHKVLLVLMVSGGSDSMAMLELVCAYAQGEQGDALLGMIARVLPAPDCVALHVLHVNHMLRGAASDADEAFVRARCEDMRVACEVQRVDVGVLAQQQRGGIEAIARQERYRLADAALERAQAMAGSKGGFILTAHTLDDRIETFFMRSMVGTGPGGLGSIPRARGRIRRPLLDAKREDLREWLRARHPGMPDDKLWCEDETNMNGENFRSQVRMSLVPVLRELRPGFEHSLAQTMDLIAEEDESLQSQAESVVYRSLIWDGVQASIPIAALKGEGIPMQRRILRACLLVVNPDARLESAQIDRILVELEKEGYVTEVSGGLRVRVHDGAISIQKVQ